jgi:hypothetical protein
LVLWIRAFGEVKKREMPCTRVCAMGFQTIESLLGFDGLASNVSITRVAIPSGSRLQPARFVPVVALSPIP